VWWGCSYPNQERFIAESVSDFFKPVNIRQSYKQEDDLSRALSSSSSSVLTRRAFEKETVF